MFNRTFLNAVRQRMINLHAWSGETAAPGFGPSDVVAFVDLQSTHYFLQENCRVQATRVHLPDPLRDIAAAAGLKLVGIKVVTGNHDQAKEPDQFAGMRRRLGWLERNGASCSAIPLHYFWCKQTGRQSFREKGVDVRIACEVMGEVSRGLGHALIVAQDADLCQAVRAAGDLARERGGSLGAYSLSLVGTQWPHNGKCAMHGIDFTTRLPCMSPMLSATSGRWAIHKPPGPLAMHRQERTAPANGRRRSRKPPFRWLTPTR